MAGTLGIRVNGEEVATYTFDSLEGVTVQGMNIASYYRSPDPENDISSVDILGENLQVGPARAKEDMPGYVPPEEPAVEEEAPAVESKSSTSSKASSSTSSK